VGRRRGETGSDALSDPAYGVILAKIAARRTSAPKAAQMLDFGGQGK
jgi:hypothetical protein